MERLRHRRVTARAQLDRRLRERGAVTRGTRELADVRVMTGAVLYVEVRRGHLLGHALLVAGVAAGDHDRDDDRTDHGREPIG